MLSLVRRIAACAIMAAFLLAAEHYADPLRVILFDSTLVTLIVVCGAGLAVYGLAALLTGALRPSEVRAALKRS